MIKLSIHRRNIRTGQCVYADRRIWLVPQQEGSSFYIKPTTAVIFISYVNINDNIDIAYVVYKGQLCVARMAFFHP